MARVNWKVWILAAAAVAAANCVLPASAADQVAPVHKAVSPAPAKKMLARPHAIKIAYIQPTSRSDLLPERYFPLVLGVAY